MEKKCPKCSTVYSGDLKNYFFKSTRRRDGFDWRCKPCKRKTEDKKARQLRDARRIAKDGWKIKARELAREHYKALTLWCHVLGCSEKAEELHHVDYEQPLAVVPLCKKHHEGMHN